SGVLRRRHATDRTHLADQIDPCGQTRHAVADRPPGEQRLKRGPGAQPQRADQAQAGDGNTTSRLGGGGRRHGGWRVKARAGRSLYRPPPQLVQAKWRELQSDLHIRSTVHLDDIYPHGYSHAVIEILKTEAFST